MKVSTGEDMWCKLLCCPPHMRPVYAGCMSTELVVAGVSFLFSLGSVWYASRIDREQKDRDAVRTYRFEAQKRLYEQCEPLLFQLAEAAENARGRIHGLARTCRDGHLTEGGEGWLKAAEGYFFLSTLYRLLAPVAVFHMLRRRLTSVDLNVDARIKAQYDLARVLYRSFRDDHDLAEQTPEIDYKIDVRPQGVLWGKLDNALEAMTPPDKDGVPQLVSFGRFEALYKEPAGDPVRQLAYLLVGFHPATHPVLWRMLLAQTQIYETLLAIHRSHGDDPSKDLRSPQHAKIAWRSGTRDRAEVEAAQRYIENRLAA